MAETSDIPVVKLEVPDEDDDLLAGNEDDNKISSALDVLVAEAQVAKEKANEATKKHAESMVQPEKKRRARKAKSHTPDDADDWIPKNDIEKKEDLKTFGLSSRPRRAVNYASIERGDEATANSLVTEFTSGKRKSKRSRDEMDENYEDEDHPKSRRKTKSMGFSRAAAFTPPGVKDYQKLTNHIEQTMKSTVPNVQADRPSPDERSRLCIDVDNLPAIRHASGGFRRFVSWISDQTVEKIRSTIEHFFEVVDVPKTNIPQNNWTWKAGGPWKLAKLIRHAWNVLPMEERKKWEKTARMDSFESAKLIKGISMPLCEIPLITTDEKPSQKTLRPLDSIYSKCCSLNPIFSSVGDIIEHFLEHHDTVHFYACSGCNTVFASSCEYRSHTCPDFNSLKLKLALKNEKVEMKCAYFYIACSHCGLWLPMRKHVTGISRCWTYFQALTIAHPTSTLIPVLIYSHDELILDKPNRKLNFSAIPRTNFTAPLACKECETVFEDVEGFENHMQNEHVDKLRECTRCQKKYGSEFTFCHHALTHFNDLVIFANYLRNTATYHPPADSNRLPHYGSDPKNVIVGGFTKDFDCVMQSGVRELHEFVKPDEELTRRKLRLCLNDKQPSRSRSGTPFSMESDDSRSTVSTATEKSDERRKVRSDMGYEHVDYEEMLNDSDVEAEAKKRLQEIMGIEGENLFDFGEKLLNAAEILELLKGDHKNVEAHLEEEDDYSKLSTGISVLSLRSFDVTVGSCVDPLKDNLLFNRIYHRCLKCHSIFSIYPELHVKKCGCAETDMIEIWHPALEAENGVGCFVEGCEERLCSIMSLRAHLLTSHGEVWGFETLSRTDGETPDNSMLTLSQLVEPFRRDQRTRMAKFTDFELGMPVSGVYQRKVVIRPTYVDKVDASGQAQRRETVERMFVLQNGIFECNSCTFHTRQLSAIQEHIRFNHVHSCMNCGRGFMSAISMRMHICSKVFERKRRTEENHELRASCKLCPDRVPFHTLFHHIVGKHPREISMKNTTGELFPQGANIRLEPLNPQMPGQPRPNHEMRTKMIRRDLQRRVEGQPLSRLQLYQPPPGALLFNPKPKVVNDMKKQCYLCDMVFDSPAELLSHLEQHPEQWKKCPYCKLAIRTHYEMQRHLISDHVLAMNREMVCGFCRIAVNSTPGTHLLYLCPRAPHCGICGVHTPNPQMRKDHLNLMHKDVIQRFQCSFCRTVFVTMDDFHSHTCRMTHQLQSCDCDESMIFTSIDEFCDHFDSCHVRPGNQCGACYRTAKIESEFVRHRFHHMKPVSAKATRKVYLLQPWLRPRGMPLPVSRLPLKSLPPNRRPAVSQLISRQNAPQNVQQNNQTIGAALRASMMRSSAYLDNRNQPRVEAQAAPTTGSTLAQILGVRPKPAAIPSSTICEQLNALFQATPEKVDVKVSANIIANDDDGPVDDIDIVIEEVVARNTAMGNSSTPSTSDSNPLEMPELEAFPRSVEFQGVRASQEDDDDDDDLVAIVEPDSNGEIQGKAVIKEVVDENGDDELEVVAEVEHSTTVLPSQVARRDKKFKCQKCSASYMTNQALRHHMGSHRSDAGDVGIEEVFGLPDEQNVFVCKSCCLAYQSKRQYDCHVVMHGDTQLTCRKCSGIGFNPSVINQHHKAHMMNQVFYACGTCRQRFETDLHLMEHMTMTHDVVLFYFCKVCSFGTSNLDALLMHCNTLHASDYTLCERIGAVPASLLNYVPENVEEHKTRLLGGIVRAVVPSECAHRNMLLASEGLVTCVECHCLQSLYSYIACIKSIMANPNEETDIRFETVMPTTANHRYFPLINFLRNRNNKILMTKLGRLIPKAQNEQLAARPGMEVRTPAGSRVIRPTKTGPIVITPTSSNGVAQRQYGRVMHGNSRFRALPNPNPSTANGGEVAKEMSVTAAATVTEQCTVCKATMSTAYDKKKHEMHKKVEHEWFCQSCAFSDKSEMQMMLHFYERHILPTTKNDGKPLTFELKCPHPNCRETAAFSSMAQFDRHLHSHVDILPYQSDYCNTRFGSEAKKNEHNAKHADHEKTSVTSQCCSLCGSLDMWSLSRDYLQSGLSLSHIHRHGLDHFSQCRICFIRFPEDSSFSALFEHHMTKHLARGGTNYMCVCGASVPEEEVFEHMRKMHSFNVVRQPVNTKDAKLVVKTGVSFATFVGLKGKMKAKKVMPNPLRTDGGVEEIVDNCEPSTSEPSTLL